MSMSDCEKCWDTPCTCGWDYRYWEVKQLEDQILVLQAIIDYKKANQNAKLSGPISSNETVDDVNLMNEIRMKRYKK